MVQNLVVIDERGALGGLRRPGSRRVCGVACACVDVGDTTRRVEESSTELLAARRGCQRTLVLLSSAVLHTL